LFSFVPGWWTLGSAHLKEEKKAPGEKLPALTPLPDGVEFGQRHRAVNTIPKKRITDFSSTNAFKYPSARIPKSFRSSHCAPAIRIETEISYPHVRGTQPEVTTSGPGFSD
jgi:hypothetical protein